ncbi:peptidase domain-containing ABC transporter [Niveispirillum sp.]|uniref:peptidase domain-containing ABC transporter n=1 Tax=Niveispirillum sp. TaxID=1917217 RepID=UPI001B7A01CD|nr:peptidase domain-containing ABC transporter [Niveispirillum sp.]MBP7335243.1 peptidase domain-containing ABC transporter [Niveispirillum sp.]
MVQAEFEAETTEAQEAVSTVGPHSMLEGLRFIARHHGLHLSREQLIRQHARDDAEVTPSVVVDAAERAGMTAKVSRMRFEHLLRLGRAIPALLRLRDGTARLLITVHAGGAPPVVVLRHPMDGAQPRPYDMVGLAEIWDGEVILFKRQQAAAEASGDFSFDWLLRQLAKDKRIFRDVGLSALVLSVFALVPPFLYFVVVNRVLVHQRMSTLFVLIIGIFFVVVFDTVFGYLRRRLMAEGTARIDARISGYIFDRLLGLPLDVFERQSTGTISYKISEAGRIRAFLTGQAFTTLLDSTVLLVLLPVMFYMHATLTFFVLAVAIVMFAVILMFMPAISRSYSRVVRAEQRKGSLLIETIHGMRTIKTLALEGRRRHQWDDVAAEAVTAHRDMGLLTNVPQTILQPLEKLIYSGSLLLGCYLALTARDGAVAVGALLAFTMLAGRVTQPFVQIAGLLQTMQEVRGALGQVASLVNIPAEDTRATHGLRPRFVGNIQFEDVRFRYSGAQSYALDQVSFHLPPGSVTGIMGRSGSGKTTVTRMLQGLHQEYDGLIKIDGTDLRQLDLLHLRSNLGVVLQENFLFSGTIRENIGIVRPDATFEEIIDAARLAGAEEFIERLPSGYDTQLTEGGSNLSGGQRQRLAIARALLVDPPILILDEATSALDPDSEAIVNNNLRHIAEGRTMIVISHRLASLVDCDQIIVMERGKVFDIGTHEELLDRCAIYRHFWYQQNRHQSPPPSSGASHERSITGPAP